MGAPLDNQDPVEHEFYNRPRGTLSNETVLLSLAYCLSRMADLRAVCDLNRLTQPERREVRRILATVDPPLDSAIPLRAVAPDRSR